MKEVTSDGSKWKYFGRQFFTHWKWWVGATTSSVIVTLVSKFVRDAFIPANVLLAIICVGLFVALGRMWSGEYDRFQSLATKYQPKFRLECGSEVSGSRVPGSLENGLFKCEYFRLKVTSLNAEPLTECCGHLTEIRKGSTIIWGGDNHLLPFAPAEKQDAICKTVRGGVVEYLDILSITEQNAIAIRHHKDQYWRFEPPQRLFRDPGEYTFTIVVSAIGAVSATGLIRFIWTGNKMTTTMALVEQH